MPSNETHVIRAAGAEAHATFDAPAVPLAGGLRVTLVETAGPWSRVRFANGAAYWVGTHVLEPIAAGPPVGPPAGPPRGPLGPPPGPPAGPPPGPGVGAPPPPMPAAAAMPPTQPMAPVGPPRPPAAGPQPYAAGPARGPGAPVFPGAPKSSSGALLVVVGIIVVGLLAIGGLAVVANRDSSELGRLTPNPTVSSRSGGGNGGFDPNGGFPTTTLDDGTGGGGGGGAGGGGGGGGDGGTGGGGSGGAGSTGPVPDGLARWSTADDRSRVEGRLGQPVAFFRNFGSADDPAQPVLDTYVYPQSETRFLFGNGVFLGTDNGPTAPPPPNGGVPEGVTADDFTAGMVPSEVSAKLGSVQDSFSLGSGADAITEETYGSGQAFYSGGRLVWVYVGAVADATAVAAAEKQAATQATTTVPAGFTGPSGPATTPTARPPAGARTLGAPRTAALQGAGTSVGAAASLGGVLSWIYHLVKRGKEAKDTAGLVDTARMHAELLMAKQYLDDEVTKAKQQLDAGSLTDLEKHQVEQLIATAQRLSSQVGDVDSTLPKGASAIDQFLPWFSPSTADTTDFKAGYDALVQRLGGTDRLDERTKAFLERAHVDWKSMGADARRSLLVSLFRALVYKACGGGPVEGKAADWQDCIARTLNDLRRTDFPPATPIECLDALKKARDSYESSHLLPTQTSITEPVRSCPVPGLFAQPPVEDYGVFTADIDIVVGTQTQIENIPTCSFVGWGLDCTVLVGEAAPVSRRLGPFKTEDEAQRAFCASIVKGSEHTVPNVAGGARVNTSFGTNLSVDNVPGCS